MSAEQAERPWGTVLVILTLLAGLNELFDPFEERAVDPPTATFVSGQPDPMVRRSAGWAPARGATVTPGTRTVTDGAGQCTTNFVFTDVAGRVYLGQAAHCAGLSDAKDGCRARTRPLGTTVTFTRAASTYDERVIARGRLAYSSWRTMQQRGETRRHVCAFNDFALVRLPRAARDRVNPTLPFWGGPDGLARGSVASIGHAYGFGRSSLRRDDSANSRQSALLLADQPDARGWSHTTVAASPGIPGDSGSGYLDQWGEARGTLSTLTFGAVLSNGLGDLAKQLAYARRHSGIRGLRLELGTRPFHERRAERADAPRR